MKVSSEDYVFLLGLAKFGAKQLVKAAKRGDDESQLENAVFALSLVKKWAAEFDLDGCVKKLRGKGQ